MPSLSRFGPLLPLGRRPHSGLLLAHLLKEPQFQAVTQRMIGDQQTISLVPPARLGALLSTRRRTLGLSLDDLAARSDGSLTAEDLSLTEHGHFALDDHFISQVTSLYECDSGPVVPVRHQLIIDIDRGEVVSGSSSTTLPRTAPIEILERYLAFVYLMRNQEPGTTLSLREQDVKVLSLALELDPEQIKSCLVSMMSSKTVEAQTVSIRKRISVSAVGLLVGFTSIGALILTPDTSAEATDIDHVRQIEDQSPHAGSGPAIGISTSSTLRVDVDQISENNSDDSQATGRGGGGTSSPSAPAGPEVIAPPDPPESVTRSLASEAEALITYDWQTHLPGWTVNYSQGDTRYRGLTNRSQKSITIYVRDSDSAADVAGVLAHEIGHAIDLEYLSDDDRLTWLESRDLPEVWWVGDGHTDFSVGQGDFAEAVASIMVGSPSDSDHGEFSPEQLELASSLLPS